MLSTNKRELDLAVTPDGRQLRAFGSRSPKQIVSFTIGAGVSLTKIGTAGGIVCNSDGLVAT